MRQGYRPAAPIQRFNNKSLIWPAWFRHFRAVADVHGWNKDQRALQLGRSYLDETTMNVAQEMGDNDLYNYDVLVKLLSDRFDPALRVSAFRSRFHGRSCRHHEDADTFADVLSELCQVGYPQSPPELRQELIAEQFVWGQSDPELKKYLWVVIRTQKDKKLQTLIEICTDFSSVMAPSQIHQPTEQTFAVHQEVESYPEDEGELEDMFAVGDRPPWNNRRPPEPSTTPTLQQMFTSARHMGYKMRPIARQTYGNRSNSGNRSFSDQNRGFHPQTRVPVGTTPGSSVSVVASLDTCKHVAHSRTHPYRSDLRVGSSSPTIINQGMAFIKRETLHRPGPHQHRSTFISSLHSFSPHAIIMHQTKFISLTTGYFIQSYSTTAEFMYGNMFIKRRSGSCEATGDPCQRCYRENTGDSDRSSEYFVTSRQHRTGDTTRQPVCNQVKIGGRKRPRKKAVMQISGAGHWFLEGWIGDHAVDFLVDSGSAVTALFTITSERP